jgi:probable rRNA maturation factor
VTAAPRPVVEVSVESPLWADLPDIEGLIARSVQAALDAEELDFLDGAEVSVLLADDARVRELNREWRDRDQPTNVLSFPAAEPDEVADAAMIGDIVLAFETIGREAAAEGRRLDHHVQHLVVHGLLHLFGYDHMSDDEAEIMEDAERRALALIGVPDPYHEGSRA